MSSSINLSQKKAVAFNNKFLNKSKLNKIPSLVFEEFPGLNSSYESLDFYNAVISLQKHVWPDRFDLCDGMLGNGTITAVCKAFDFVVDENSYWVADDKRHGFDSSFKYVNYDQKGGLDLHKYGNFSRRKSDPTIIVVHWGGLNVDHCYRVFSTKERKVSSHAGIGYNDKGEDIAIKQFLDLEHKSWHAGWANSVSVGIDICQQPDLKWKSYYKERGYNVEEIENNSGRGPKKCLSLDPKIKDATIDAIKSICNIYNIPFDTPRDESGNLLYNVLEKDYILNEFTGVIGHHHISKNKWDCAPWWSDLFES